MEAVPTKEAGSRNSVAPQSAMPASALPDPCTAVTRPAATIDEHDPRDRPGLGRIRGHGHGRVEVRITKVLTASKIAFSHAVQAVRVHRWVKEVATGKVTRTYTYLVTRLPAEQAGPGRVARLVRQRRRVEALHHVRDVSFSEDASRVRSGTGPRNMATLRNLAIPLLAGLGYKSIPQACRWVSYGDLTRPLDILGPP